MKACCNESGDVGHIYPEHGAALVGDLTEALEVDDTRVCGCTGDDHLRMMLHREGLDLVIIDVAVGVDAIRNDVIETAGEVRW